MKIQRPPGTKDIYGRSVIEFRQLIAELVRVAQKFNFQEIITPLFEQTELFLRAIGNETDIVSKEIYQFNDKGNRSLALRPEGTAGVIRALIENKLYSNQNTVEKYFYYGAMYRYERPQLGRSREFYQFGIEALGSKSPYLDIEIILLAQTMLEVVMITDYELKINFFGSDQTKAKFEKSLITDLNQQKEQLCEDCQKRINKNPLRVLDCKIDSSKPWNLSINQFYSNEEAAYFQTITKALTLLGVQYQICPNLVRGLDYYDGIIFEFVSPNPQLGKSQNTIIGGGRYDHLCEQLGLPAPYPAVGFAVGIDRLLMIKPAEEQFMMRKLDLFIVRQNVDDDITLRLLIALRIANFQVDGLYTQLNQKQISKLITNKNDSKAILVLQTQETAICYQLLENSKIVINYSSITDLLQQVKQFLHKE